MNINCLLISNYKKGVGGISGQVEILLESNSNRVSFSLFNTKTNNLKRSILLFKLLKTGNSYDLFHIHACSGFGFFPAILGIITGKILKKKMILTYHGGGLDEFLNKNRKIVTWFLSKVNIITVPSRFLQSVFLKENIESLVLPNMLRTDNVSFKKRSDIFPHLIVTRSFESVYNIPLVLKAYKTIKLKYPDASLRLIGDGSLRNELLDFSEELNLEDVTFVGRVENKNIGVELNKSDIYINPTTKDSFAVSMFEAFACGLPVISTNVGAISDFVEHGKNGYLIENNNTNELVEKIEYIIEHQEELKEVVFNARNTFDKFTFDILFKKYEDTYSSLLQNKYRVEK